MKLFEEKFPKTHVIMADTGDYSGDPDEAGRVKTHNLIEGMGMIGYDVINLGERELALGIAEFRKLTENSHLNFINANIVYRDTGEPFVPPHLVKEYTAASGRTVKVGFLGLNSLNSSFAKETPEGRVLVMRDPAATARKYVPALKDKVDLLVLLGNLSQRDLGTVLGAAPGIHVALLSYGARLSTNGMIEQVEGVPTFYGGDQGKRLAEVRITFPQITSAPGFYISPITLTKRYPEDPALQALIDRTVAKVNEINKTKAGGAGAPVAARGSPARAGGPHEIARRGEAAGSAGAAGETAPGKPFLTATACATCHSKEHEIWYASAHARAFDTLVKANQDFNPECVKCHVTGSDQAEGFLNARQTPDLINVQCEACHGNGSEHIRVPQAPFGKVAPRQCFTCHTKENSPDFVFFKYWDKIKH